MPKTINLGLNLTDDKSVTLGEWQASMDGNNDTNKSNMQLIDEAFGEVASILDAINGEVV